jgi:hypothetical protein
MEIKPAYHVAFLVRDLAVAIPDYERALGITFRPPQALARDGDGAPVRSTYSYEGPPYVQLLEARPTGVYGIDQGEGFHHFGVWVDDAHACRDELGAAGLRPQLEFSDGERTVAWYNEPADLHGVRIEYTGEAARPGVEAYLRGERSLTDASAPAD